MALQLIQIFRIFSYRCHRIFTESSYVDYISGFEGSKCVSVCIRGTWYESRQKSVAFLIPASQMFGNHTKPGFRNFSQIHRNSFFSTETIFGLSRHSVRFFINTQDKRKWEEDTENSNPNFGICCFPIILLGLNRTRLGESVVYIWWSEKYHKILIGKQEEVRREGTAVSLVL
jgi:hypothetical protein